MGNAPALPKSTQQESADMRAFRKIDMNEATRLTRAGRLHEAMAVLRGETASVTESSYPPGGASSSNVLDFVPPSARSGGAWTAPFSAGDGAVRQDLHSTGRGSFEERRFSGQAGSRTYKLYVPSTYKGQALPLLVMLHGCTQSPDDFAVGTRMNELAEERSFLVAYPAQPQTANMSKCWNWYNPADQRRDAGEPSLIAGITRQIIGEFQIDTGRVYIAGLSAGGAAAAIMGKAYPDLFAAVGVHSGLACGAARDMPSAFTAMRQGASAGSGSSRITDSGGGPPTIVFHGDRDTTVNPINGDQVIAQSKKAGLQIQAVDGQSPGGVRFTRTSHLDIGGRSVLEHWVLHGTGHAWSGGSAAGSYTEPRGPDASREMMRFFLQHSMPASPVR
jgi:poly(hydroxyalkanoate) depolymerase family esterase